jgi:hypothetical protein
MRKLGFPVDAGPKTWVQTERAAHEAWSALAMVSPRAAALMHQLVANMGAQNAVVVNQKTLAKMMKCNVRTVQRAIDDLVADRWIDAVSLGGAGTVNAYIVNDQVAWGEKRNDMPRLSLFSAAVVANLDDQDPAMLTRSSLRKIPVLHPSEMQLPSGPGEDPPSQPSIPGFEQDLPAITAAAEQWSHLRNATPDELAAERDRMIARYEEEKRAMGK